MDGLWGIDHYGNYLYYPRDNDQRQQQPPQPPPTEVPPPVTSTAYQPYTDIPGHFKHKRDRRIQRSDSEIKSIFVFKADDNSSADIPSVVRFMCAYCVGLHTVVQELQQINYPSPHSMEVDAPETETPELFDDFASDADFIWCGMTFTGYQERLKSAKESSKTFSWMTIYEQFIGECDKDEKALAEIVQQLRDYPDKDVKYFCRDNLIRHTKIMIEKWKRLSAVAEKLNHEKESLKRLAYPCREVCSDIELHYGSEGYLSQLQLTGHITMPADWNKLEEKDSNAIRRMTLHQFCKELHDAIVSDITEMDSVRKGNYIKLHKRHIGLQDIISHLNKIYLDISNKRQGCSTTFTDDEIWYNEFDLSYVDMHYQRADVTEQSKRVWDSKTKRERPGEATQVFERCCDLHLKYGEMVKGLRSLRESTHAGAKTHVSELEARVVQLLLQGHSSTYISDLEAKVVQLNSEIEKITNDSRNEAKLWFEKDLKTQQYNAELTTKLDEVNYKVQCIESQVNAQWKQHLTKMQNNYQQHFDQQQSKVAEARDEVSKLKIEKEKLLTRLSKIAGNKLVQGNPAITDLSDVNRPTKLSERYSELYDNEWTDALEELTDSIVQGGEVVFTNILLGILIEAFTFCCETEVGYVKTIKDSLTTLPGSGPDRTEHEQKDTTDSITLSEEQGQQLNDLMKTCVPMMTKTVELKFLTQMEKQFDHVIKTAGRSIKHDFQTPLSEHKEQKTLSDPNEPKTTAYTEDQATGQGITDHEGKDHINTNEDVSTPKSNTNIPHPSGVEQATADTSDIGTTPSKQAPTDRASEKHHRKFEFGPSNVTSNQTNQQKDDTSSESDTTDTTFQIRFSSLAHTYKFAKSCVNLCWLMRIQNPPLHMDTELVEGSDINGEFYKNYTQKGKQVGYLVWPALFLHKGGPLLCKGIVQPSSNRKP